MGLMMKRCRGAGAACLLSFVACLPSSGVSRVEGGEGQSADVLVIEPVTVDFGRVNNAIGPNIGTTQQNADALTNYNADASNCNTVFVAAGAGALAGLGIACAGCLPSGPLYPACVAPFLTAYYVAITAFAATAAGCLGVAANNYTKALGVATTAQTACIARADMARQTTQNAADAAYNTAIQNAATARGNCDQAALDAYNLCVGG